MKKNQVTMIYGRMSVVAVLLAASAMTICSAQTMGGHNNGGTGRTTPTGTGRTTPTGTGRTTPTGTGRSRGNGGDVLPPAGRGGDRGPVSRGRGGDVRPAGTRERGGDVVRVRAGFVREGVPGERPMVRVTDRVVVRERRDVVIRDVAWRPGFAWRGLRRIEVIRAGVPVIVSAGAYGFAGETEDQVIAGLGQPDDVINTGFKSIYVYPGLRVVFVDGQVADVLKVW